ncbi:MAG: hypothetical protein LBJ35_07685 [Spirochaetaceae bacterium]|nr:hypothetical protein [Spirochaetaceae bacterium]
MNFIRDGLRAASIFYTKFDKGGGGDKSRSRASDNRVCRLICIVQVSILTAYTKDKRLVKQSHAA